MDDSVVQHYVNLELLLSYYKHSIGKKFRSEIKFLIKGVSGTWTVTPALEKKNYAIVVVVTKLTIESEFLFKVKHKWMYPWNIPLNGLSHLLEESEESIF